MSGRGIRELLLGAERTRRDEDEDEAPKRVRTLAPGKLAPEDAGDPRWVRDVPATPGKLTLGDVGRGWSPADAVAYATHVSRRAEPGAEALDDDGALATAFRFVGDSAGGHALPTELAARLGRELGVDLSSLRIHTDDRAARAAATLKARAFTIGHDVYFADGAYDPSSADGVALIAHEAAHVAQHVRGNAPTGRGVSRPDDAHEHEAEAFAHRFRARAAGDPATLVEEVRTRGTKTALPFLKDLEEHFGADLGFVETYTGEAAKLACELMSAGAFAVRNIVALADPSPQRELLMHELTHVIQSGGTRAPVAFQVGSLSIGAAGSAVEHEAEHAPRAPAQRASPDTIHRAGDGTAPAADAPKKVELDKALDTLLTKAEAKPGDLSGAADRAKVIYGTLKGGYLDPRLYKTSKAFDGIKFKALVESEHKGVEPGDLKKAVDQHGSEKKISKVKGSEKYIVYADSVTHATEVDDADKPGARWEKYKRAVDKLQVPDFTWPKEGAKSDKNWTKDDAAYTGTEEDYYRRAMVEAIGAMPKYAATVGHWDAFHKDVVLAKPRDLDNRTVGEIFGKIVETSAKVAKEKKFTDLEKGDPIFDVDQYGLDGGGSEARGDGVAWQGENKTILVECKAKKTGPTKGEIEQAENYRKIITQKAKGYVYKGEEFTAHTFDHVIYAIADSSPDKKIVKKWYEKLITGTPGSPGVFTEAQCTIVPPPDGHAATFGFNPQFTVDLGRANDPKVHYVMTPPPVRHPGIEFKTLDITMDEGKTVIQKGSVVYDVKAGDIEQKNVKKTFAPQAQGAVMATADGKMSGLKSSLDKLMGPVKVDAAIVDGGVEATLQLTGGAAKSLAGFTVDGVTLKARYSGSGSLKVDGKVALKHKSGKIDGSVSIGWANGEWTFAGDLTVKDGMIPGVSQFTCGVEYENGNAIVRVDSIKIEKKFKAVTLTGTGRRLSYDTKKGAFSGEASLEADLGMFGRASAEATIADNDLKKVTLAYDSPELKYPAKASKPAFIGTIGGEVTYDSGKFSGSIRGTANLNMPALQKIAGDGGLGLAVDAHIDADGAYSGTIKTTSPLKFGKHFQIPKIACTIDPNGDVSGDFSVKVVDFKYLEKAQLDFSVTKDGITVKAVDVKVSFGAEGKDKFWGELHATYEEAKGLKIGGTVNAQIKEGMIARGTLDYSTETNSVDVKLTVDEIKLFEYKQRKNLFTFSKQIPLVSFYQIIGIYLDVGFDLDFEFDFSLGLRPTIKLEGLSMDTWNYDKVSAEIELIGALIARLIATPKVGLGIFAIDPMLLRGGGGLKVPITGEAALKPKGKFGVNYTPSGGVEGDAKLGMSLTFGIKGAVKPYAEVSVLDGAWNPNWTGDALTEFEILPPKELFNFELDFGGKMEKQEPKLPSGLQAPGGAGGGKQLPQEAPQPKETGNAAPGREATPPQSGPTGEGAAPDDPIKLGSMLGGLKGLPGYATITGFMEKAGKVWEKIKGFFGRVAKAFKSFFESMASSIEEILDGFAAEGLGYLPKLIKKIVGDSVWDIIEPIVNAAAGTADAILGLFETDPPKSAGEFFTWGLKLMQKAFGVAFDSIGALVSAIGTMVSRLSTTARKIVTKMVQDGMIGVRRHAYYIWTPWPADNINFLAATEYKIHVLGADMSFRESGMITDPRSVVGVALFEALESLGVPSTNDTYDKDAKDTYRDRWV